MRSWNFFSPVALVLALGLTADLCFPLRAQNRHATEAQQVLVTAQEPPWIEAGKAAGRSAPTPLPGHPGNVFVRGEDVEVTLPGDWVGPWQVVDYDGQVVAEGQVPGKIQLGRLPAGYYEIPRGDGTPPIGIGVLARLVTPTPRTSPIGVDSAAPWLLGNRMSEAASLCALAGVNWARGRLTWGIMEPKLGEFAAETRYDAMAREFSKAGIQVLQVNHYTPEWAGAKRNRFPTDLRDAYRFYREMARRWKGQVQAFEPWNEADWPMFGGHTGAEMASLQKACYWGLKAGNPDVIVCQNVFANYFPEVVSDFHANRAWPYYDTLNFHHYWSLEGMPRYYEQFRKISAGRPMWVTECNFIRGLATEALEADPKLHDLTPDGLRRQAAHVHQIFAISIHGGSAATFWFMLAHYHEGPTQFGLLRPDLTPRPGYLALATAGRLLADAQPVGRLRSANEDLSGYLFHAKPDGRERIVLIAWTTKSRETIDLPTAPEAVYDTIGREQEHGEKELEVSDAPVLALFAADAQDHFDYEPAPTMPPQSEDQPSPVVLQSVWPPEKSTWPTVEGLHSHYWVGSDGPERIPIHVYNFGETEAKGRLTVAGPQDWTLRIQEEVALAPMERAELALTLDLSSVARRTREEVRIEGDFGPAGRPLLSLRLLPLLPSQARNVRQVPALLDAKRWKSSEPRHSLSSVPEGLLVEMQRGEAAERRFSLTLNIEPGEAPTENENALLLPIEVLEGDVSLSLTLTEENGERYEVQYGLGERSEVGDGAVSLYGLSTALTVAERGRTLDASRLRAVTIHGQLKSAKGRLAVKGVAWATF